MKNLFIFFLFASGLIIGLTSCLTDKETEVNLIQEEEVTFRGPVYPGITLSGRIHRAKETLNNGKHCDCAACFGLCGFGFHLSIVGSTPIYIFGDEENGSAYIYLLAPVDHAEDLFFIDEDLEGPVQYGDELEDRVLKAGRYLFEQVGIDYEDEDPENPTFGRVEVRVE